MAPAVEALSNRALIKTKRFVEHALVTTHCVGSLSAFDSQATNPHHHYAIRATKSNGARKVIWIRTKKNPLSEKGKASIQRSGASPSFDSTWREEKPMSHARRTAAECQGRRRWRSAASEKDNQEKFRDRGMCPPPPPLGISKGRVIAFFAFLPLCLKCIIMCACVH
jgi:hypothetical protein